MRLIEAFSEKGLINIPGLFYNIMELAQIGFCNFVAFFIGSDCLWFYEGRFLFMKRANRKT
jgi:hypothetical protein